MPLTPGARLGPYDILAPIGAFLFVRAVEGQAPINLVVAVDWFGELKRVPTN